MLFQLNKNLFIRTLAPMSLVWIAPIPDGPSSGWYVTPPPPKPPTV